MAGRRWDGPWQRFPESKPLAASGGVATSKQRGAMAATWWSKRFVEVLESFGLGSRMQRGRRYARSGQVLSIEVSPGLVVAQVQGSRRTPYLVSVRSALPTAAAWAELEATLRSKVGFVARLLAGEVPAEMEEAAQAAGLDLFPTAWSDLTATCNCPDWENPCKHLAAVLYVFADRLDGDPWLLLAWRGRAREEVLAHLGGNAPGGRSDGLPAWWPLVPGHRPGGAGRRAFVPLALSPDPAHRVLARMGALDVEIAGTAGVDLVATAYETIVAPTTDEPTP